MNRDGVRRIGPRDPSPLHALMLFLGAWALVFQLTFVPLAHALSAPAGEGEAAVAALAGEHGIVCGAAQDQGPAAPDHHSTDCTDLCCQLGHHGVVAYLPPSVAPELLSRRSTELDLPRHAAPLTPRPQPSAQARGPPISV